MYQYLYKGLIHCTNCQNKFRGVKDKSVYGYICLGYSNQSTNCKRIKITESQLSDFLRRYCDAHNLSWEMSQSYIRSLIEGIYVDYNGNMEIHYLNGDKQWFKDNGIKYV
jgi:hypothetical protein